MIEILGLICALALAQADPVRTNIKPYNEADPKRAPIICALTNSDGILIAHEHCNQFYQCWDGKPIARHCYGTLNYNPKNEICDWPDNVDCGERIIPESTDDHEHEKPEEASAICSSEGSEDLTIAHRNCNKFFKCHEGKPVTFKCPGHLLYNTELGYCDCADNVVCDGRPILDDSESSGGEQNNSEESVSGDPSEAPHVCAAGGSDGVLVAHENCNKFYKCANGAAVAMNCYGDLLFDPVLGHCEWPEKVECGGRKICEDGNGDNGNTDNEGSENENEESDNSNNEGAVNCDPSEAVTICSSAGSDGTLVAHENCNKYYICAHKVPVVQKCPGTLLFDPFKDYCDWPDKVECGDRVISENEDNENNGNDNGDSDNGGSDNGGTDNGGSDNGSSGTCNCNPGEAPAICAVNGSNGVFIAHENCNKYYICANGRPVAQKCPSSLLFDPFNNVCDWPDKVECGDRVISENEDNESSGNDNGGSDNGGSDNGGSDNGSSDNGGSENGDSGTCNCNPGEAPTICAADGSNGVFIAHENCNKYYICANGRPVAQRCPSSLLFDPFNNVCDWPDKVECGDRVISENEDNEISSNENGGSDNGGTDNGGSDNGGSGTCNCNPGEAPAICAVDGSNGISIAHENCNKYYICANGRPVAQKCPSSLLFDPFNNVCDWPDNVECGDRVISENEVNETSGNDNESSGNDNGGSDSGDSDNGGTENGGTDNGGSDNGVSGSCNCNPGEAPAICAVDGSNGVFIAHENCNKYYICANGRPVSQKCPSSLLFDPFNKVCDWPDKVECGDRVISENEDNESSGNDNEGSDNGGSDNGGSDNGGSDNGGSDNGGSDNGGSDNGGSDNGGSGTCNCNPGEAPAICSADGSDGIFVAHEDCDKFYTCVAGRPVTMKCPELTLYNPFAKQCDWADNVNCGDRVIPEDCNDNGDSENGGSDNGGSENGGSENGVSDNGESDNGGSENGESGTCNCNPGEAPAICAADGSDGIFVAHEDCDKFYTCVAGRPVTMKCPELTLYNPYAKQCDWTDNVSCGDRVIPEDCNDNDDSENGGSDNGGSENGGSGNGGPDDGGSDNGGSDNGGSENGESGTCNCNPGEAPAICAADGSDGIFVAHEDCDKFYTCVAGRPVTMKCPELTLYNPYAKQCDWTNNVSCGDRVIPEDCNDNDDSENGGSDNGGSENGGSENGGSGNDGPDDGGSDNGGSDNGASENGESGTCNCNPGEAPAICAADGSDGIFVAHEDCDKFYTCVAGRPVTMKCPELTLYNPYAKQCDWADNVNCGDRVIPENCNENGDSENGGSDNGGLDNGGSDNGGSDNGGSDNSGSENGESGTCNCNPGEAPAICAADGSDGIFVAHEDCDKFYTCVAGRPVTMKCPERTLYNPYAKQCDWADNVNCGDRAIPEDCNDNGDSENGSSDNGDSDNGDSDNGDSDNGGSDNGGTDNGGSDNDGSDNGESGTCNCNPAEAPAICAVDGSDGVFVAHENCNEFYTCVAGQPITIKCAGITLYNPYTQRCDWPENVVCGDRVVPEDCIEGNDSDSESSENGSSDNGEPDSSGTDNGGLDNGESGTCNCNPAEAPEICAADGSDGVSVAHENCNEFYTCVEGQPITIKCAGITLYNPFTQRCDWPENVVCGERLIVEDSDEHNNNGDDSESSDNGGSENDVNTDNDANNSDPNNASEICAKEGSDGVFVAHEKCNQFYTCLVGKPVTVLCAGITLYNPITQRCDWPENVSCGNRVIPGASDNGNNEGAGDLESGNGGDDSYNNGNNNGGSENDVNTDNDANNNDPNKASEICAKEGSDGVFVAHENCNQFYTCLVGKPVTVLCAGITLYNPITQRCDWPENVSCEDRVIPGVSDNGNNEGAGDLESGNGSDDSDNNGNDNNGDDVLAICTKSGSEGLFLPHEKCNQFYVCIENQPVILKCSGVLVYNIKTKQCDWPENVDCGSRVPNIVTEAKEDEVDDINIIDILGNNDEDDYKTEVDDVTEETETDDVDDTEIIDETEGVDETKETGEPEQTDADAYDVALKRCAEGDSANVRIPHEECHRFYVCMSSRPIVFTCTSNHLYDIEMMQCNYRENVNCGKRVIREF